MPILVLVSNDIALDIHQNVCFIQYGTWDFVSRTQGAYQVKEADAGVETRQFN